MDEAKLTEIEARHAKATDPSGRTGDWINEVGACAEAVPALVAEVRRLRGPVNAMVAALEHMAWCRACAEGSWADCAGGRLAFKALGAGRAALEESPPPVCPKGHGPMIRVECCPKCAEDVPGVTE